MTAKEVLKKWWGYDSFRPKQEEIVQAAVQGKDVLAILPTGGGKSICFQVPALMKPGLALVVTPLIALMKDQVQNLRDRGIRAIAVYAGMTRNEVDLALNNATYGDYKFLYISPERLGTRLFRQYLRNMEVSYIIVDEAHCISQWGYDFRPDYLNIGQIRQEVDAPVIAVTATATPTVADDIMTRLGFREKLLIKSGFERPNLSYIVRETEDKLGQIISICESVPGTGIVYVRSRKRTEELAATLRSRGISASFYHAGLGTWTRTKRQEEWKNGTVRVMVCTNAFGMGIDKPDVRFVIHQDIPDSPEAYFQEAGRGGRDGKRSYAVLLWNSSDIRGLHQRQTVSFPDTAYMEDIYQKVHIFLGIPYEYGEMSQHQFDFEAFCKKFGLSRTSAWYAIKYIEKAGHWTLTESADVKTRVMICVDRGAFYNYKFDDPVLPRILEILMRKYTGIYNYPVSIDEDEICAKLSLSEKELHMKLYDLSQLHLIRYIPSSVSDVILLNHERLMPKNIDLKPQTYEFLKKCQAERTEAMVDYVTETTECRSRFLLRYFGQTESHDCGTCDICRTKKAAGRTQEKLSDGDGCLEEDEVPYGNGPDALKHRILETIVEKMGGVYGLDDLKRMLNSPLEKEFPEEAAMVLRELIDSGKVPPPRV